MRTLIVIPARLAAVRLPQKPLRLLGGAPLVAQVWQRVAEMKIADRCVVATDDRSVLDAAAKAGAEAVMTSSGHISGTDRVAEVASMPQFADYSTMLAKEEQLCFAKPALDAMKVQATGGTLSRSKFVTILL